MKLSFRHTDKIVGAFLLIAIFVLMLSIIFVLINQKTFTKKHYYSTVFYDRVGLKIDTDIIYNGFAIGKIKKLTLNEEDMVVVDFYIYEKYFSRITEGSVLNRVNNPLSGSTVYFIRNRDSEVIIPAGNSIPSLDMPDGIALLNAGVIKPRVDAISNILVNVDRLLMSLNSDHNAEANAISRILVNSADIVEKLKVDMYAVSEMLDNFKTLSFNMREAEGLVQRLVDPEGELMFNSLQKSLNELAVTMEEAISSFSGFVNNKQTEIESLMLDSKRRWMILEMYWRS